MLTSWASRSYDNGLNPKGVTPENRRHADAAHRHSFDLRSAYDAIVTTSHDPKYANPFDARVLTTLMKKLAQPGASASPHDGPLPRHRTAICILRNTANRQGQRTLTNLVIAASSHDNAA